MATYKEGTISDMVFKTKGKGKDGKPDWEIWEFTITTQDETLDRVSVFTSVKGGNDGKSGFSLLDNGNVVKIMVVEEENDGFTNIKCIGVYKTKGQSSSKKATQSSTQSEPAPKINADEIKAYCTDFLENSPKETQSLERFIAKCTKKYYEDDFNTMKEVYLQKTQN